MKFFKQGERSVFAFEEDGSQDHLISDDMVQISQEEVDALVNPVPTLDQSESAIKQLYDKAMAVLQNGYSDKEVNTFPYKKIAAEAIVAGGGTDQQKYLLAHRKGFVNNASPSDPNYLDVVSSEVQGMTDEQKAIILDDARKIMAAAFAFDHYSSLAENLRDKAIAKLVDDQDNTAIVEDLKSKYGELINA